MYSLATLRSGNHFYVDKQDFRPVRSTIICYQLPSISASFLDGDDSGWNEEIKWREDCVLKGSCYLVVQSCRCVIAELDICIRPAFVADISFKYSVTMYLGRLQGRRRVKDKSRAFGTFVVYGAKNETIGLLRSDLLRTYSTKDGYCIPGIHLTRPFFAASLTGLWAWHNASANICQR